MCSSAYRADSIPIPGVEYVAPLTRFLTPFCLGVAQVLETYAQGGRGVVTSRMYPTDDALGVKIFVEGGAAVAGATLLSLDVWEMDTIWVDKA